jgi:HK97 gp10 family phage protein
MAKPKRRSRKRRGRGTAGGFITVDTNAAEIAAKLGDGYKHFAELEMRGVVSKAVNTIRDRARENAEGIGLSATGLKRYAGGQTHVLRGLIPSKIFSYVLPNAGEIKRGRATIDISAKRGPTQTYHAYFIEFGTSRQSPRPFFLRALPEAQGKAMAAAQKRFDEGVARILD